MSANWPWTELGLDAPAETDRAVRRAYATRLRAIDIETDIAGFEALRSAYEAALSRVGFLAERVEDKQVPTEARLQVPVDFGEDTGRAEPTVERDDLGDASPDFAADDNKTVEAIVAHLKDKNYALETWQTLLSEEDISRPETKLLVEGLIVGSLRAKPLHAPYPPERWLRLVDTRYGWSADGVGFARRHPTSGELLADVVERLGIKVAPPMPVGGRTVHLFLRWYAILIYALVFLACHSFVFV